MTLKQRIMALREQGYRVREIAAKLGCSHSTVVYHSTLGSRETHLKRVGRRATDALSRLKLERGGKCQICGYDEYLPALHFHHVNPKDKKFGISRSSGKSYDKLQAEADKCVLVCANDHALLHGKVIPCPPIPRECKARSNPRQPTRKSAPRRGDSGQSAVRVRRASKARG